MSDDDSLEFCARALSPRAGPQRVISWDTLYLVFKDRFSASLAAPRGRVGVRCAGRPLVARRGSRKSFENRRVNEEPLNVSWPVPPRPPAVLPAGKFYGQAMGLISTGQLNVLPRFHTQPINVVVYHESHRQVSSRVWLHA